MMKLYKPQSTAGLRKISLCFVVVGAWFLAISPSVAQEASTTSTALSQQAPTVIDQADVLSPLSPSSVISNGAVSSAYILGPSDVISVSVQPQGKYGSSGISIQQDGTFEYPRIGTVSAAGKTVSELRDELIKDLSVYCVNPDVTVQLTALRPQVVYVTGGVKTPKVLDVRSAPNVAKAITLANGAVDLTELTHISVFRNGVVIPADVYGELVNGVDTGHNINLQPGDLVVVPVNTAKYAVVGAVNTPGVYTLATPGGNEGQVHLADALAAAGGALHAGAKIHSIEIVRAQPDGINKTSEYDYGKFLQNADITQNPVITDRDLIFVPDSRRNVNFSDTLAGISYLAILKGL